MKKCSYCGRQSDDSAVACGECGNPDFDKQPALAIAKPPVLPGPARRSEPAIAVPHGSMMLLRCRTPDEAYLVAEQLEATDILPLVPDTETMQLELREKGYISIAVSAEYYKATVELPYVIERRHWTDRAHVGLTVHMGWFVFTLGLLFLPGWLMFAIVRRGYTRQGFTNKAKQSGFWFVCGLCVCCGALISLRMLL
jgi:hypothetical protein